MRRAALPLVEVPPASRKEPKVSKKVIRYFVSAKCCERLPNEKN